MNKARIDKLIEDIMVMCDIYANDNSRIVCAESPILPFFHNLYSKSNEELYEFFPKLNLKNARVMTVGSSGDQVLYSLMFGAKEVVCVDINPFTKFFYDLKVASIKHFTFEEFGEYFAHNKRSEQILNIEVYKQISHLLPEDSIYFWDNLFLEINEIPTMLFTCPTRKSHYSVNKKQFNTLKKILNKPHPVKFECGDIRKISKSLTDKKYDVILLSNIYDYVRDWEIKDKNKAPDLTPNEKFRIQQKEFFTVCKRFLKALNPNGFLQVQNYYDYDDLMYKGAIFEKVFNKYNVMRIETSRGGPVIVQNTPLEKKWKDKKFYREPKNSRYFLCFFSKILIALVR